MSTVSRFCSYGRKEIQWAMKMCSKECKVNGGMLLSKNWGLWMKLDTFIEIVLNTILYLACRMAWMVINQSKG
jgi:hypothetical protein